MGKLENEQHERFCNEYLVDFCGTKAAARSGYSKKTAGSQAFDLLKKPEISARVKELHEDSLSAVQLSAKMVLEELKRIAVCDVNDAFNPMDGTLLPLNEIPVDVRKCIAGFQVEELWMGKDGERVQIGVVKKVKFWDKNKGLELLGKYFKLFTDRVEHDVSESLEALITASMAKGEGDGKETGEAISVPSPTDNRGNSRRGKRAK